MTEIGCGAAYPCQHAKCGMSQRNSCHKNKRHFGYHEYVPPRTLVETHILVDATCAECTRPCTSSTEDAETGEIICEACARVLA